MRFIALTLSVSFVLMLACWPCLAVSADARDFVFTDEEGHLVLRYAGTVPDDLTINQQEEIQNSQLSTMVHDRLQADTAFEAEPVDDNWAATLQTLIKNAMAARMDGSAFSSPRVECRSTTCRLSIGHAGGRLVSEHQGVMDTVQQIIEEFIQTNPGRIDPGFLIAGLYQEPEAPYIKVFLRRTEN